MPKTAAALVPEAEMAAVLHTHKLRRTEAPVKESGVRLLDFPQDMAPFVCQFLRSEEVLALLPVSRRVHAMAMQQEVWRFFCRRRWGKSANLHLFDHAKDCLRDQNGWFPREFGHSRCLPSFQVRHVKPHDLPGLTMDMRMTHEDLVMVTEAPSTSRGMRKARMLVLDPADASYKDHVEVSESTINCCDMAPGRICIGGDDSKVRLFRRSSGSCHGNGNQSGYCLAESISCNDTVNDLRLVREDAVVALKTIRNRHPAGMDLIHLERPDARRSIAGGCSECGGKFLHALDCFEQSCSLTNVVCTGEHPVTSCFSAMLFDFRRSLPCVLDVPVTENNLGTMLWPLRTGRFPQVYANLLHEGRSSHGEITMVDFRFPSLKPAMHCKLPSPIEDFRCLEGSIYAVCADTNLGRSRLRLHRFSPGACMTECLCTVAEAYDGRGRTSREDLKVFSVCPGGFAIAYGNELALGSLQRPQRWMV
ncbi:unnamed protein product [Effrenium voratum]|nr:unnamed protein product [Effrenium voratum]